VLYAAVGLATSKLHEHQLGVEERRRDRRREQFRQRLGMLLEGEAYQHLAASMKDRLLAEVPALAFSRKGREM
jgi:hypothetical protein